MQSVSKRSLSACATCAGRCYMIAINSQAPFGRPTFYSTWLPERPVQTTLIQPLSSRLRHKAKRSSAHVVAASCLYSTRLLAATASIRDFCGMLPPHAARSHGFTCKQRSTASLAGFWSCCHFPTTAAGTAAQAASVLADAAPKTLHGSPSTLA